MAVARRARSGLGGPSLAPATRTAVTPATPAGTERGAASVRLSKWWCILLTGRVGIRGVVLELTQHLGTIWRHTGMSVIVTIELVITGVALLTSVLAFIQCVVPPITTSLAEHGIPAEADPELFFPEPASSGYDARRKRLDDMTVDTIGRTLSAELLVIVRFRAYKSTWARRGFILLQAEVVLAMIFLATLGVAGSRSSATSIPGASFSSLAGARSGIARTLARQETRS